jgi:hypothetical protein
VVCLFFAASIIFETGCTKDPKIPKKISSIIAGDKSAPSDYINHSIDLNQDFIIDISFSNYLEHFNPVTYNEYYKINPLVSNGNDVFLAADKNGLAVLSQGDIIDKNSNWVDNGSLNMYSHFYCGLPNGYDRSTGNWTPATEGYIGFKIVKRDHTYWGWIHMFPGYEIKDYSYIKD